MCQNCLTHPVYARARCHACYRYHLKYKTDRPADRFKVLGRHHKLKPKGCKTCESPNVVANLRCKACYRYYQRTGKNRPRHLWDDELTCTRCGWKLRDDPHSRKDLCNACYHQKRAGK